MINEGVVRLNEPCPNCGIQGTGEISRSGPNSKLTCNECGRYIKFVGKSEVFRYVSLDINKDTFKEINNKLDLIMDHLGIVNE